MFVMESWVAISGPRATVCCEKHSGLSQDGVGAQAIHPRRVPCVAPRELASCQDHRTALRAQLLSLQTELLVCQPMWRHPNFLACSGSPTWTSCKGTACLEVERGQSESCPSRCLVSTNLRLCVLLYVCDVCKCSPHEPSQAVSKTFVNSTHHHLLQSHRENVSGFSHRGLKLCTLYFIWPRFS